MSSWASIAKASPQPVVAAQDLTGSTENLRLLVVDANAIISGIHLDGIADRAVTIQEVFDEIRDKQSRQFLTNLPYKLQLSEPTEESIKTVTRFARETGDVAALSSVDIKLLALAHTLEAAAHGTAHLAAHASQPRMHSRATFTSQALPGWGNVSNPEDWKVVDEANEQDDAAAAGSSRIAQQAQQLSLDPTQPNNFLDEQSSLAGPAVAASAVTTSPPAVLAGAVAAATEQQQARPSALVAQPDAVVGAAADGEDDDDWEVAASSQNAARRKKRKQYKRQEKQRAFEQEWEEHAAFMQQQQQEEEAVPAEAVEQQQQQQQQQQNGVASAAAHDAADTASGSESQDEDEQADGEEEITNDDLLTAEHQIYTTDDIDTTAKGSRSSPGVAAAAAAAADGQQQQGESAPGLPGWQSSVACITADFAMQNVLLQMGLRLLTRDGRRIARLSRYALRCSACFNVTREPGRIFCPKCGNMTLDRVEVVVGPDGAEYFGIKKRHILRGTKYSLPKPRGGRNSKDPVLREDIFLLKVKALGKRASKKKAADGDADGVDPFAPEFNQDTWHVQSQAELAQHRGLAAVLQPAWKNNPNERKLTRSNRRG